MWQQGRLTQKVHPKKGWKSLREDMLFSAACWCSPSTTYSKLEQSPQGSNKLVK